MQLVQTNQCWPQRRDVMTNAIRSFTTSIDALEIGAWFGEGSTRIWLDNLVENSSLHILDSWTPYTSTADQQGPNGAVYRAMDNSTTDAYLNAILQVKKFELHHPGRLSLKLTRGDSAKVMQTFKDNCFDFIYIDGDHRYENAKCDIAEAKRIIKKNVPFAMICGDDLEALPTPELCDYAKNFKDVDFDYKYGFHPGLLLAISESFNQVNMSHGFWWVVVRNGEFCLQ